MRFFEKLFGNLFTANMHIPLWGKFLLILAIIGACVNMGGGQWTGFKAADIMSGVHDESGGNWILILIVIVCIVLLVKSCGVN